MNNLKAYLQCIDAQLLTQLTGKPKEFVDLFLSQKFISEEAFMNAFCGKNKDRYYYTDWKSKTLKILQAFAIVSTKSEGSFIKKKYDNCQKKFFVGYKILREGQREEGIRLIKQAYKIASEYDFVYLACELASILSHHHVYYEISKKKSAEYDEMTKKYLNDYIAEKKAGRYYFNLVKQMNASTSLRLIQDTINLLNQFQGNSIRYKVYLATTHIYYGLYSGDCQYIINNCTSILSFLQNKKGAYPAHYLLFLRNRGTALTSIGKYQEAKRDYEAAEKYTRNVPYNFHLLQYYRTLNALHAGDYGLAYEIYQKNKRCKIESIKLQFAIIEAYLCFLVHIGFLKIDKNFRLGKFLNETIKAQHDKRGDNVNILIAELLIYLARDKFKFTERVETVQNYTYRHLQGESTKRAKWFLKILCYLPHSRVNFNPTALHRVARKYIQLLKNSPMQIGTNFSIEIIPFDKLLDTIIDQIMMKRA